MTPLRFPASARRALAAGSIVALASGCASVLAPGENLLVDGIPPIPAALAESLRPYTEFRPQRFLSWHPERREMLIGRRAGESAQVHRVAAPGEAPRQITRFREPVAGASYAPGYARLFVYAQDAGGSERYQLYRFDLDTERVTRLTDEARRNSGGAWSRDGRKLAYSAVAVGPQRRSEHLSTEVRIVDPSVPETDRLVARLPGIGWSVASWSPDGRKLALSEYRSINESTLWLLDIESAARQLLTPRRDAASYRGALLDPGGGGLFALSDRESEYRRLVRIDLATREERVLVERPGTDIDDFELTEDGRLMAYVVNDAERSELRVLDMRTHVERPLPAIPHGIISGLRWHRNGNDLAFNLSSARSPLAVYSIDVEQRSLARWTRDEPGTADPARFALPELVRWRSFDGREISGWLYRPGASFPGRRPVIVDIHGGPEAQSRPGFKGRYNYLVDELGIALLFPNVRGSTGFGKSFTKLDDGRLREDAVRDIGALLDRIAEDARLDPRRVLVAGGSYGGYMSLAVATLYPERIACAIDAVGISNFVSFLENTESYRRDLRRAEYGDERDPEMRRFLESISPLNRAERIMRPLFVVQGANDPRVPASEAERIVATLKARGTPVWYLLARDEGHGFAKKPNADFEFYATVMFARRCLIDR